MSKTICTHHGENACSCGAPFNTNPAQCQLNRPNAKVLGSSHTFRYEYWTEDNNDVYQYDLLLKRSLWFCRMSVWEHGFSKCNWILFT